MSKVNELRIEGNQIITENPQITLANLDPKNQKVIIWGYELCNGAEWKDFLDVVNKLGKDKADLEAKLAGLQQEKIEYTDTINFVETSEPDRVAKELDRLNEKLAEKEETLANAVVFPKLEKDNAHKGAWYLYFLDDAGNISYQHFYASKKEAVNELEKRGSYTKQPNQDKISFAVAELEKVKETFTWGKDNGYLTPENAVNIIDNQIKMLKGGK